MREYIYILFIPFALLLNLGFVSCEAQDSSEQEEVKLQIMLGDTETQTRVTVVGEDFTDEDKFQFFFDSAIPSDGSGVKTAEYTFDKDADTWSPLPNPIYWDNQTVVERSFCAFLPYNATNNLNNATAYSFSVGTDQSTENQYQASDLLIARVKTAQRLIPLKFWHVLSKVVVNVTASTDAKEPDSFGATDLNGMVVELTGILPDATVTYGILTLDDKDNEYNPAVTAVATGTATNIKMLCTADPEDKSNVITGTYTAVIPPQNITSGIKSIIITLTSGTKKTYHFKHKAAINFEQGKQLTIDVVLKKSQVEISDVDGDVTIEPWGAIAAKDDTPIVLPK